MTSLGGLFWLVYTATFKLDGIQTTLQGGNSSVNKVVLVILGTNFTLAQIHSKKTPKSTQLTTLTVCNCFLDSILEHGDLLS